MGKRIAFTGGSGVVGRTVVPYLIERGHKVLNLDLKPLDAGSPHNCRRPRRQWRNIQRPFDAF